MMLSLNQLTISFVLVSTFLWFRHGIGFKEVIKKLLQI